MNYPSLVVGDRVRLRYPDQPNQLTMNGTVTLVFQSAMNYYDVQFDAAQFPCVLHASAIERIMLNEKPPS